MEKIDNLEKINILLVDDDENYLKITKLYLEENGMNIRAFSNPKEALEVCKKEKVDIILLDYFMPEMTGEEFVKELRNSNKKSLIILQTGFSEKKPPIETLTALDIQGYHDKTKGADELLLLVLSAIKTINLIEINQKQELSIDILTYKKQFLGSLILGMVGLAENQVLAIDTAKDHIAEKNVGLQGENALYKEDLDAITRANRKLREFFNTINFENIKKATAGEMINILNILLKDVKNNTEFEIDYNISAEEVDSIVFNNSVDSIVYATIETINYFVTKEINKIQITFEEDDNRTCLKISNPVVNYTNQYINIIKLIASSNSNMGISISNNTVIIYSKKS